MKRASGIAFCLLGLAGCGPTVISAFGVHSDPGVFSTDLKCTNQGQQLADVDLYVTAYFERGTSNGEGHYREWRPGESKTVSVSSAGGSLQRIFLTGKAHSTDGETTFAIHLETAMVPVGQSKKN